MFLAQFYLLKGGQLLASQASVKFDMTNLNELIRSLKQNYFLRVGIIGSNAKAEHPNSGLTNAELGTIHEQPDNDGSKMPKRSFLEMPLKEKLKYDDKGWRQVKKSAFKNIFIKKKPIQFYNDLGQECLQIIEDAFATNGFGSWQAWSEPYLKKRMGEIKSKKKREAFESEHNILVATGKMRRSISFKVMSK